MKKMPCGGAPIDASIVAYFHGIGINVKVGYGLTETMATVTLFGDTDIEFASVGKTIAGSEIKIGANDEILVKGTSLQVVKSIFIKEILSSDGVEELLSFEIDHESETRLLRVDFTVKANGKTFNESVSITI